LHDGIFEVMQLENPMRTKPELYLQNNQQNKQNGRYRFQKTLQFGQN